MERQAFIDPTISPMRGFTSLSDFLKALRRLSVA